jgi:DNA invertase Pin-like site-specific DNA recombinase
MIDVAAYLRMSSDQQDMSIEQQRREIQLLAERLGYRVVAEYVDSGLSGSLEISRRKAFLQMIEDSHLKKWSVILCWDVQRFGRLDPLKAAKYKDTLRNNGVHLHTCKEGLIKWESFVDYVVDVVYAAAAHQYSLSLSKDTIRGRLDMLERGEYPNGKVPYGYDRLYVSPEGDQYPVARAKKFKKGRGWKRYLTVNSAEAEVVKWIFDSYCDNDLSMREIARQVQGPRPDGSSKPWTKDTIKATLTNKLYAGYGHIGGLRNRLRAKEAHNRVGYHEKAGCVPALVSIEQFEKARAKVAENKEDGRKVQPSTSSPLTGVLICGHCGYRLEKHSRTDPQGKRYSYFSCSSALKRPALGCKQWRVREDDLLPVVIDWVYKEVGRAVLAQAEIQPPKGDMPTELESLHKALDAVAAEIDRGAARYLLAPDELKDVLEQKLKEWKAEREELERRKRNLIITEGDVTAFAKWWQKVESVFVIPSPWSPGAMGEPLGWEIEKSRFRQVLRDLGFSVTIFWRQRGDRFYAVDYVKLDAQSGHAVAGISSKYSRVHSLGRG